MTLKLSKTALRELKALYRIALLAGIFGGAMLSAQPAVSAEGDITVKTDGTVVNNGGSEISVNLKQIETNTAAITDKANQSDLTAIETRVTSAEGKISAVETSVADLGTRTTNLDTRVTNVEGKIISLENSKANQSDLTALDTRVGTAEGEIDTLQATVAATGSAVTDLQGRVTTNESKLNTVEGKVTAAESKINSLETTLTTKANQSDLTALTAKVGINEATVDGLQADVSKVQDDIGAVTFDNDKNLSGASDLTMAVNALDTAVGKLKENGNTIKTTNTVNENLSALDSAVQTNATNISKNADDISALDGRMTTAEGNIQTNAGKIADNTAAINTNAANISKNADDISALDGRMTTAEGNIQTNATNISKNADDIAKNLTAINQNKTDIQKNASDITALDTRVTGNTSEINTNKTAIANLDTRVNSALGGDLFKADGSWAATVEATASNGYAYTEASNVMAAINQVAGNIGTADHLTTAGTNGVSPSNTVNQNIDAVNAAVGDRTYTAQHNVSSGESVTHSVDKLDRAIGNRQYASERYISSGSNLTTAMGILDSNLARVEGKVDALEDRTNKMHHEMKSGFASLAAMSALVPNARATGNTQISFGTGHYRGTTGFAVGGFHYLNDDVLLNAGAAYAGNGSATFKSGVTFGF